MDNTDTYGARIRFFLDRGTRLNCERESFVINLGGVCWQLEPFDSTPENKNPKKLSESEHLVMAAKGFPSEKDAREHGSRVKAALSLCGAALRIGLDVGRDSSAFVPTYYWKDQVLRNTGRQLLNDLHGLSVYSERPPAIFVYGNVSPILAKNFSRFEEGLLRGYEVCLASPRLELALELYARSHFEASGRTRFLTLINAIEAVAVQRKRSGPACELVESFKRFVKRAKLNTNDKESMLGTLERMKHTSIGQACRDVVESTVGSGTYGEKNAKQFLSECYTIRSELLHEGDVSDSDQVVRGLLGELNRMVADLLVVKAGTASGTPE